MALHASGGPRKQAVIEETVIWEKEVQNRESKKKGRENTTATLSEGVRNENCFKWVYFKFWGWIIWWPSMHIQNISTDSFTSFVEKSEKPVDTNSMVAPKFGKTTLGNPPSLANAVKSCLNQNKVPYLGKTRERSSLTKALVPACTGLEPSSTSV